MIKRIVFLGFCLVLASACEIKQEVDLIVTNANIYTVDSTFSKASAVAIQDGRFVAVSDSEDILQKYSANEQLDAEGKTMVPGLIDAHCHFYGLGMTQQVVNLRGTTSYEDILEKVSAFQKERPSAFILGRGWDQND